MSEKNDYVMRFVYQNDKKFYRNFTRPVYVMGELIGEDFEIIDERNFRDVKIYYLTHVSRDIKIKVTELNGVLKRRILNKIYISYFGDCDDSFNILINIIDNLESLKSMGLVRKVFKRGNRL
ncbi:hypothetical protein GOV12_02105 [Candidatus Pacearchaeota archaeon]|nr:hypothetical protein [Candidatus Pacearchaeota archaeon]